MTDRFYRVAETMFPPLCAWAGAFCHPAEEDENGWDYLVEFPPRDHVAPADTHPPPPTAYVQVKSTEKKRMTCRVKLSNALKAARSPQPWFIVFVVNAGDTPPRIYAVHVWEDLIRRTLKKVRAADNAKMALNQCSLTIQFCAADERGHNLIPWMRDEIDAVGPDYEQRKTNMFQSVGYEDGYGIGQVTVRCSSLNELTENFLGFGNGLSFDQFTFTRSRFGVLSPEPAVNISSGVLHITPSPAGTCEVRLRGLGATMPIVLPGQIYAPGIPGLPRDLARLRFSTRLLEIVYSPGGKSVCRATLEESDKVDLGSLEHFSILMEWCSVGAIDVQVWADGARMFAGDMMVNRPDRRLNWPMVSKVVRSLRSTIAIDDDKIKLSLTDLEVATPEIIIFHEVVDSAGLRVGYNGPAEVAQASSIVYYCCTDAAEFTFYVLIERPVFEDVVIAGRRQLTCGEPRRLDSYVLSNVSEQQRKMMNDDYERHLHRSRCNGTPLGLGDINAFRGSTSSAKGMPVSHS